ncbi:diguanylate cyclase [Azoarcus taiwanensis]|uniref:diguanylate cyclase n=2 Tax=Azoarcus taiwanensis TaxID=666964 RepID=A0A972FE41_9RHOO|nr:diguanylate cyclase [Azoarcus taiwanensis]
MANDVGLSMVLLACAWRAWRTGDTRLSGWIVALSVVVSLWLIGYSARFAALFWTFPGVLILFFLVPPRAAIMLGLLSIAGAASLSWHELGGGEGLPFFVFTTVFTAILGFVTSQQAQHRIANWRSLSLLDPLTGIGNRRQLEFDFEQLGAWGREGVIAALDLDHFKRINDECGHETGDAVLRTWASTVQAELRRSDRLYRLGGEEFLLWMPDIDTAQAEAVFQRLRTATSERVKVNGRSVTCSAGAIRIQPGENWQQALARADEALYEAKQAGRDRLVLAAG